MSSHISCLSHTVKSFSADTILRDCLLHWFGPLLQFYSVRRQERPKRLYDLKSLLSFCSHHSSSCGNSLIFITVKDKPNRLFELVITYFSWCVISFIHFEKLQSVVFSVGLSNEEPITVLLDLTNAGSDCCKLI